MSTWILLRGLARESRHWGAFPGHFGAVVGAERVVALDLPGNGELNDQPSPTRVEAMADWVAAELARRALNPPVRVLALSLGAMVAAAWACRAPAQIEAMVLINTSMRPFNPVWQRLRPGAWGPVLRMLAAGGDPARLERAVLGLTSNDRQAAAAAYPQWCEIARTRPVSMANTVRQLWAAARFEAPRERPPVPCLVLVSAHDRMVDPRCSQQLAEAWGAGLMTHPQAGHDLPLDDGDWVARSVAQWLAADPQVAGNPLAEAALR